MILRRLAPDDAAAFHALRLAGLRETPAAFASSAEEEQALPVATIETWLVAADDRGIFGAFQDGELVGVIALARESMHKLAHKGLIWGLYVSPAARGRGVASALMNTALGLARSVAGMRQVNISVNANNLSARRLYESLRFRTFGCERRAMLVGGEAQDELHMCLHLDAEAGLDADPETQPPASSAPVKP